MDPILIVDDDAAVRKVYRRALEARGLETVDAADGTAALERIATTPVALVLLDNHMPGLTGLDVLQKLREDPNTATLPVILVTGRAETRDRIAGLEAGASDYLTKPVELDELIARVHAQLRGQAAWSNRVVGMIEQRARLAFRLNAIPRSTDVGGVSAAVCGVLAAERSTARAWVVRFPTDDVGLLLADSALAAGDPRLEEVLAGPFVRDVRRRAAKSGAWVHEEPLPGAFGDAAPADRLTVVAPLYQSQDRVSGALVVQFIPQNGGPNGVDRLNSLATVLDLSPVVAAVLRPALDASDQNDAAVLDLRQTIQGGAFLAVTQPIVRLADGAVVGHEALTRFDDGTRPDVRFREAVRLGIGHDLELATLDAALTAGSRLPESCWLSLNVSSGLLGDDRLIRLLNEAGERSRRPIVLEITEHEQVQDYAVVRQALARLTPPPRIAVDDAGSGYASLRHILRLEPAFVKLDRTWVAGIEVDPARQAMIAGLRHFASQIGAELIGEGVERQAELDTLASLGVTYAQGYLLGLPSPVPAASATTTLKP